ncbi:MAG: hypothetical protein HKP55_01005 [Gammaproteobacteria bacterium]|nr:hypothetical protein [Gammaproteobacteria bacterium]
MKTLVLQSHRNPLPFAWLEPCVDSVKHWSDLNAFDYRFLDDELFAVINNRLRLKFSAQMVILTDLARLLWIRQFLQQGYHTVVWFDADFVVFNESKLQLPDTNYALGREVWVQKDKNNKLRAYIKVHNAFLLFRKGNVFLDFYIETANRLLDLNEGNVPPQFIGPKLLTALHNIAHCPVMETAGMLSPLVITDILNGEGKALELFSKASFEPLYAANLGASVVSNEGLTEEDMLRLTELLRRKQNPLSRYLYHSD